MFRLVFVILRTKNRLILCHFTHCDLMSFSPLLIISSVFHEGGVLLRIHAIVSSNFSTGWMWTKQSPIRKSVSLYMCVCVTMCVRVCVCVPLCVFVWGWGGVGACMNVCSCLYCFKYRKILVCSKCYKYFTEKRVASYWPCFWRLGDICGRKKSELLLERIEWNHYNIMYRLCNQLH